MRRHLCAVFEVRLNRLPFDVVIKTFCIQINEILFKKKQMAAAVVNRVANPSPAPALIAFNIFNKLI